MRCAKRDPFIELYRERSVFRFQLNELKHGSHGDDERKQNGSAADDADDRLVHPFSKQTVDDEACSRKKRNQPNEIQKSHLIFLASGPPARHSWYTVGTPASPAFLIGMGRSHHAE